MRPLKGNSCKIRAHFPLPKRLILDACTFFVRARWEKVAEQLNAPLLSDMRPHRCSRVVFFFSYELFWKTLQKQIQIRCPCRFYMHYARGDGYNILAWKLSLSAVYMCLCVRNKKLARLHAYVFCCWLLNGMVDLQLRFSWQRFFFAIFNNSFAVRPLELHCRFMRVRQATFFLTWPVWMKSTA